MFVFYGSSINQATPFSLFLFCNLFCMPMVICLLFMLLLVGPKLVINILIAYWYVLVTNKITMYRPWTKVFARFHCVTVCFFDLFKHKEIDANEFPETIPLSQRMDSRFNSLLKSHHIHTIKYSFTIKYMLQI